ncbi:MAG: hypothetical protein L3J67_09470 [Hyphomicrobiaceae bacterium]|nr:hypothetical protein [Hyphomicrobiaceae bacterium]
MNSKVIELSLTPLIGGAALLYYFSGQVLDNAVLAYAVAFGWFCVIVNTPQVYGALIWHFLRWQKSVLQRSKATRAMHHVSGIGHKPFKSLWLVNGFAILATGWLCKAGAEVFAAHQERNSIYAVLRVFTDWTGWPIVEAFWNMGAALILVGMVCLTIPFLVLAKTKIQKRKTI